MTDPIIIGKKLPKNHLTVTGIVGRNNRGDVLYSTHCDCDGPMADSKTPTAKQLRHNVRSCGCLRFAGTKEMRNGTLTLVGPTEIRQNTNVVYLFKCDCGKTRTMTLMAFKQAVFPTCREPQCEARRITKSNLPPGEAAWNRLFRRYQDAAASSSRAFELTKDQAISLFQSDCFYCGRPPSKTTNTKWTNGQVKWNGIDRFDNLKGDTHDNCVACCAICNFLKGSMHGYDFLALIRRIVVVQKLTETIPHERQVQLMNETADAPSFPRKKKEK